MNWGLVCEKNPGLCVQYMTNCFTCIISLTLVSITQCDICVISLINARNLYIFSSSHDTNAKLILSCTICICEILTNSHPHDHMISFHMINRICPNVASNVNINFQWHSVFCTYAIII